MEAVLAATAIAALVGVVMLAYELAAVRKSLRDLRESVKRGLELLTQVASGAAEVAGDTQANSDDLAGVEDEQDAHAEALADLREAVRRSVAVTGGVDLSDLPLFAPETAEAEEKAAPAVGLYTGDPPAADATACPNGYKACSGGCTGGCHATGAGTPKIPG